MIYWGPKVLIAILILVATWIVARAVKWVIQKAIDKTPALRKHTTGGRSETVGHQLGTIAKLIVWLVGIMAALQLPRGRPDPRARSTALTNEIFAFLPRLLGAGLIFFVGLIVARIVRQLVETVLVAANVDGLLGRASASAIGDGTARTDPERGAAGNHAGRDAREPRQGRRRTGLRADHHPRRDCRAAGPRHRGDLRSRHQHAQSDRAGDPARRSPRALWIGIAFIAARFLKTIIEAILPPTGFDQAHALDRRAARQRPSRRGSSPTSR